MPAVFGILPQALQIFMVNSMGIASSGMLYSSSCFQHVGCINFCILIEIKDIQLLGIVSRFVSDESA